MTTLHIEHAISDYSTWKAAFDRFAAARETAGVCRQRVQRPIDDANYIVIDLDFGTTDQAQAFLHFLHTNVWTSSQNAPALVGTPRTSILELAEHLP
jgi:hypothetical protein